GGYVQPLVPAQEEGENVRLPKLVRLRPLKTRLFGPRLRHRRRSGSQKPLLVQRPADRRFGHPHSLKTLQPIANSPRTLLRVLPLRPRDELAAVGCAAAPPPQRQHILPSWIA